MRKTAYFPNAIKLKTEINVALRKDQENIEMLKLLLDQQFHQIYFIY